MRLEGAERGPRRACKGTRVTMRWRRLGEWYAFRGIYDRAAELLGRSLAHGGPTPRLLLGRCYLETDPAGSRRGTPVDR